MARVSRLRRLLIPLLSGSLLGPTAPVFAQVIDPDLPVGHDEPVDFSSGPYANPGPGTITVWSTTVTHPFGRWLRIHFNFFDIGPNDFVRFTSLADGGTYSIHGVDATEAPVDYYSYALNGNAISVQLVAVPGGFHGGVHIDAIDVGDIPPPFLTICGLTDDRTASTEPGVGRMLIKKNHATYICTSFIISSNACMLTAGHCLDGVDLTKAGNVVTQFDVPASDSTGAIKNPDPSDQYDLRTTVPPCFNSAGKGDDYGVYKAAPNVKSGLNASQAQGLPFIRASTAPDSGDAATVTGFGKDDGTTNFTNQTHTAHVTGVNGTTISHDCDTRGGNSGSPIIGPLGRVVGIHTNGGCDSTGGSNSGTLITHPGLVACIDSVCTKPLGTDADELSAEPAPAMASLDSGAPNPFSRVTTIEFALAKSGWTELTVYDAAGRLVKNLVVERFASTGHHLATWDATDREGRSVSSGIYFVRLVAGQTALTRKLVLLR